MKRIILIALAVAAAVAMQAQVVREDSYSRLRVHYEVGAVRFDATMVGDEKMTFPIIEGYALGGEPGSPAVPFVDNLIVVPFCDSMELTVENAVYEEVALPQLAAMPAGRPVSKSSDNVSLPERDREVYATDAYSGLPLATVMPVGVARDRNLAHLRFAPVSINPVSGKARVCRSADVMVRYVNPDRNATMSHYERYHTPSFNSGTTLNSLNLTSAKTAAQPVRMVILIHESLRCKALERFADWKRRQGMMVDIIGTERSGSGARNELNAAVKALYTEATASEPAPTFVLMVGDHAQVPAYPSALNDIISSYYEMRSHVSDLYYTTWTDGDHLPDAYYGRFSATDTITLARIINKTILYESYSFEDDSYLDRAVLVSGVDAGRTGDNAYLRSDPTMDYIASQYVNTSHGYKDITYYKNRTSYAPAGVTVSGCSNTNIEVVADTLRQRYNRGVGLVNYSAHGDWNEWTWPNFNVSNANSMTNEGMPNVMIGNCCLSNKFDKDVCLGEALLRHGDNGGAAAYIGASQETYWDEDYYWAVGLRNSSEISGTAVTSYSSARLGMYDRLFHTHNESYEKRTPNVGSMIYAGNQAVESNTGSSYSATFAHYYWEIYHAMGDPSLMPWLGRANELPFSVDTGAVASGKLAFSTEPYAYVALVDEATLRVVAAAYANATGYGELTLTESTSVGNCFFSATAQGFKPYISNFGSVNLGIKTAVTTFPNPATDNVVITGSNMHEVTLATTAGTVIATYSVSADRFVLDLAGVKPGLYIVVVATDDGTTAHRIVRL